MAVTLTASWHKLPLIAIFKGARTGEIATKELKTYENDSEVMLMWVEQDLKQYS